VLATTGGTMVDGFFAGATIGGAMTVGSLAITTRASTGAFFAGLTTGWSGPATEDAAKTIAQATSLQRFGDIRQKAPAFRQELCVRAV
jgi:hypothetical protein